MERIRVLLVDDEVLTRHTLRDFLSIDPVLEVVGEASDGKAAIVQARGLRPDIILMDMQMPVMDGVEATRRIHEAHPEIGILGLSTFSTDRYVVPLLRAGASGYLVKDATPDEMTAAVHAVHRGDSALSPHVTKYVVRSVEEAADSIVPDKALLSELTDKELEVIQLLARGMSNKEMAQELYVTESTIKARFVKVMAKLGVRDRVQILITALERGIVQLG